jgi:hypothetical protein
MTMMAAIALGIVGVLVLLLLDDAPEGDRPA